MKKSDQTTTPASAKPTLTTAEKRAAYTTHIKQLQARKRDLDRNDRARLKTKEKNKRLILGRVYLERCAKNPKFKTDLMAALGRYLTAEAERTLFGLPSLSGQNDQTPNTPACTDIPASALKLASPTSANLGEQPSQTISSTLAKMVEQHTQAATPCMESSMGVASKPASFAPASPVNQALPKPSPATLENTGTSSPSQTTMAPSE